MFLEYKLKWGGGENIFACNVFYCQFVITLPDYNPAYSMHVPEGRVKTK
jgi:hypothetical protein